MHRDAKPVCCTFPSHIATIVTWACELETACRGVSKVKKYRTSPFTDITIIVVVAVIMIIICGSITCCNDDDNNNNNNNERISRVPYHVKHAQLRWTYADTKIQTHDSYYWLLDSNWAFRLCSLMIYVLYFLLLVVFMWLAYHRDICNQLFSNLCTVYSRVFGFVSSCNALW